MESSSTVVRSQNFGLSWVQRDRMERAALRKKQRRRRLRKERREYNENVERELKKGASNLYYVAPEYAGFMEEVMAKMENEEGLPCGVFQRNCDPCVLVIPESKTYEEIDQIKKEVEKNLAEACAMDPIRMERKAPIALIVEINMSVVDQFFERSVGFLAKKFQVTIKRVDSNYNAIAVSALPDICLEAVRAIRAEFELILHHRYKKNTKEFKLTEKEIHWLRSEYDDEPLLTSATGATASYCRKTNILKCRGTNLELQKVGIELRNMKRYMKGENFEEIVDTSVKQLKSRTHHLWHGDNILTVGQYVQALQNMNPHFPIPCITVQPLKVDPLEEGRKTRKFFRKMLCPKDAVESDSEDDEDSDDEDDDFDWDEEIEEENEEMNQNGLPNAIGKYEVIDRFSEPKPDVRYQEVVVLLPRNINVVTSNFARFPAMETQNLPTRVKMTFREEAALLRELKAASQSAKPAPMPTCSEPQNQVQAQEILRNLAKSIREKKLKMLAEKTSQIAKQNSPLNDEKEDHDSTIASSASQDSGLPANPVKENLRKRPMQTSSERHSLSPKPSSSPASNGSPKRGRTVKSRASSCFVLSDRLNMEGIKEPRLLDSEKKILDENSNKLDLTVEFV